MRSFVAAVPLSAIAFVVAVIVAVVLSRGVARKLQTPRSVAALLLFGFGLVIAATLTPDAAAMEGVASDGVCDVSRVGLASIEELTSVTYVSLNVLLFVPLGLAVGLLPRTRAAATVTVAAISLTFVVEGTQLLVTVLDVAVRPPTWSTTCSAWPSASASAYSRGPCSRWHRVPGTDGRHAPRPTAIDGPELIPGPFRPDPQEEWCWTPPSRRCPAVSSVRALGGCDNPLSADCVV